MLFTGCQLQSLHALVNAQRIWPRESLLAEPTGQCLLPCPPPCPRRHRHLPTLQFTGYLLVQFPATYTLFLASTNAARLVFVDTGVVAVANTATGSSMTESAAVWEAGNNPPTRTLSPGWHAIRWAGRPRVPGHAMMDLCSGCSLAVTTAASCKAGPGSTAGSTAAPPRAPTCPAPAPLQA